MVASRFIFVSGTIDLTLGVLDFDVGHDGERKGECMRLYAVQVVVMARRQNE
jgi:hypothetical protein